MANIDKLIELIQQRAFLQSGGGRKSDAENIGQILSNVGGGLKQGVDAYQDVQAKNLAAQKAIFDLQKAKDDEQPFGQALGVPAQKNVDAMQQIFNQKQSTNVAPNVFPQPTPELENAPPPETPVQQPFVNPRDAAIKKLSDQGLNIPSSLYDMSKADASKILTMSALSGGVSIYTDPADPNKAPIIQPKSMSAPQGYTLIGVVPTKTGAPLAANLNAKSAAANAPQPLITEAAGLAMTNAGTPPTKAAKIVQGKTSDMDARATTIANAIMAGTFPPDVTKLGGGMGGLGGIVSQKLAEKGYNYKKENLDWQKAVAGTVGLTKTLNSNQMVQLQTAFNSVQQDIQPLRDLSGEMERTGFVPANKLIISARLNGIGLKPDANKGATPDQVNTAIKYVTQMNLMRDNMAVAFMRGGVPTDQAFKLTEDILKPAYSNPQINSALDQIEKNVQYRKNAVANVVPNIPGENANSGGLAGSVTDKSGRKVTYKVTIPK